MLKPLWNILRSDFRGHRLLHTLSVLGIAGAIGLLVWMMGSFDSRQDDVGRSVAQAMGVYDILIIEDSKSSQPQGEKPTGYGTDPRKYGGGEARSTGISPDLLQSIQSYWCVVKAFPVFLQRMKAKLDTYEARPSFVSAAGLKPHNCPFDKNQIEGRWLDSDSTTNDIVIGTASFVRGVPGLGETLVLESGDLTIKCRVAGLVRQKHALFDVPGLFMSTELFYRLSPARKTSDSGSCGDALFVSLTDNVLPGTFGSYIAHELERHSPPVTLFSREEATQLIRSKQIRTFAKQMPLPTILAILTAGLIIFTTLSMGVTEQARQLAMLRLIGMKRRSVLLIVFSRGFALAGMGWLWGLFLGYGLLAVTVMLKPELYIHGVTVTPAAVIISLVCALLSAFLAALVPAWRTAGLRPMDTIQLPPPLSHRTLPAKTMLAGFLCLSIAPVIVYLLPADELLQKKLYSYAGVPLLALGFILSTPMVVIITEWLFGPVFGALLQVERRMFRRLLTGNMWRTIGTVISLSLGLGMYATIQIWGYSLLDAFLPSSTFPDATAICLPNGLTENDVDKLSTIPEIGAVLPLAVRQYDLSASTISAARERKGSELKQTNVLTIGLDPVKAFTGPAPVCRFRFVKGSGEEAAADLQAGNGCVIAQNISNDCRLTIGDDITIMVKGRPVMLRVAAVVELNWHMLTSTVQMRGLDGQAFGTLGPVFVSESFARTHLHHTRPRFLWLNVAAAAATTDYKHTENTLYTRIVDTLDINNTVNENTVNVISTPGLRETIWQRSDNTLKKIALLPLFILLISSLAVVNTVVASVRSRSWEYGVLRSVGLKRMQLLRVIVGESLLIGLAASFLALSFGLLTAWSGMEFTRISMPMGGVAVYLRIPWFKLAFGLATGAMIALLAGLLPAIAASRKSPMDLLQRGRAMIE